LLGILVEPRATDDDVVDHRHEPAAGKERASRHWLRTQR
jgi:hypothetical protein